MAEKLEMEMAIKDLKLAVDQLWREFSTASDDTFLRLYCTSYTDQGISPDFLQHFLNELREETESGAWSLAKDPRYEFPKTLMEKRAITMDVSGDSIQTFWKSFVGAPYDTFVKLFCKKTNDHRFTEGFVDHYLSKLEKETHDGKWNLQDDPVYKFARVSLKKSYENKRKRMKEQIGKLKRNVVQGDDEIALPTQQEIDKAREALEEKALADQAAYKKERDARAEINKRDKEAKRMANQNLRNQFKGMNINKV